MTGAARRPKDERGGRGVAADKTMEENSERSGIMEENMVGMRGRQDFGSL